MLKQLQEIKEYDAIFFIPHPEDETMTNINVASYKKTGDKIGGTELGDFYDIILFRMSEEDDIVDLEKFEAILVDPRVYVSRMVKDDWYGLVAKKTTTSDELVNNTFANWLNLSYNTEQ
jgi:hypothetical protein